VAQLISKQNEQKSAPFYMVSLVFHAALIILIPAVGAPQYGQLHARGGPVEVTLLEEPPAVVVDGTKPQAPAISAPLPKPPQVTEKPKPQPQPPVEVEEEPPITSSEPAAEGFPQPERLPEATETRAEPDEVASPTATTDTQAELGDETVPENNGPPEPPYGSHVVTSLVPLRFPKDGPLLKARFVVPVLVHVSENGTWEKAIVERSTGVELLDKWAVDVSRQAFGYKNLGYAYELRLQVAIDPVNRLVEPMAADERVRYLHIGDAGE
jgi:outer membrane biosynthesis protein TonB